MCSFGSEVLQFIERVLVCRSFIVSSPRSRPVHEKGSVTLLFDRMNFTGVMNTDKSV